MKTFKEHVYGENIVVTRTAMTKAEVEVGDYVGKYVATLGQLSKEDVLILKIVKISKDYEKLSLSLSSDNFNGKYYGYEYRLTKKGKPGLFLVGDKKDVDALIKDNPNKTFIL